MLVLVLVVLCASAKSHAALSIIDSTYLTFISIFLFYFFLVQSDFKFLISMILDHLSNCQIAPPVVICFVMQVLVWIICMQSGDECRSSCMYIL